MVICSSDAIEDVIVIIVFQYVLRPEMCGLFKYHMCEGVGSCMLGKQCKWHVTIRERRDPPRVRGLSTSRKVVNDNIKSSLITHHRIDKQEELSWPRCGAALRGAK